MRMYKQVKRKEIVFATNEWEIIEKRAAKLNINTTEYIREAALAFNLSDYEPIAPDLINNLRRIGVNINQLAKKATDPTDSRVNPTNYRILCDSVLLIRISKVNVSCQAVTSSDA